jgi:hypothetical protein
MAEVSVSIVFARAGHARTRTTCDVYTHFIKSVDRDAGEKLNEMFNNKTLSCVIRNSFWGILDRYSNYTYIIKLYVGFAYKF